MFDLLRADWNAESPARNYVSISWGARPGVETHHSVGLYGTARAGAWVKAIQRDHLARGWTDIFYNVGIYTDGTIVEGRPASAQSGVIQDLTVCFAGDYRTRKLTDAQKAAWHEVRSYALAEGAGTRIVWHGQRDGSACPGTNVINWLKTLDEEDTDMKKPLESWAKDAFAWAIKKGFYTNADNVDDVREADEMQRTIVFLHRYHRKVVVRAVSAGGVTAAAVIAEIVARLGG